MEKRDEIKDSVPTLEEVLKNIDLKPSMTLTNEELGRILKFIRWEVNIGR